MSCGTFLRTLKDKGYRTAALTTNKQINTLVEGDVDVRIPNEVSEGNDKHVCDLLTNLLQAADCPDTTFVYLDSLRRAGGSSPPSKRYLQALKQTDMRVAQFKELVVQRKHEDWLVMISSSQGTGNLMTTTTQPEQWSNLTLLGAWNRAVIPRELFPTPRNIDIAATALQFLGFHKEAALLDGRPIGLETPINPALSPLYAVFMRTTTTQKAIVAGAAATSTATTATTTTSTNTTINHTTITTITSSTSPPDTTADLNIGKPSDPTCDSILSVGFPS
jgi:hypothetical protein